MSIPEYERETNGDPMTPTIGVKFCQDSYLHPDFMDRFGIPYELSELEEGPLGPVLRIKREGV